MAEMTFLERMRLAEQRDEAAAKKREEKRFEMLEKAEAKTREDIKKTQEALEKQMTTLANKEESIAKTREKIEAYKAKGRKLQAELAELTGQEIADTTEANEDDINETELA